MFETRLSDKSYAQFNVLCYDGSEMIDIYEFFGGQEDISKEKVLNAIRENNKLFIRNSRYNNFYKYWFPIITLAIGALSSNIDRIITLIQTICQGN